MPEVITEVILVVGYLKEKIIEHIGNTYTGKSGTKKIRHVEQTELKGSAHCLWLCKPYLEQEEKFLILMGDDLYCREDMEESLKYDHTILVSETQSLKGKAKIVWDDENHIVDIQKKYELDEPGYINAAMYVLTPAIFDYAMVPIKSGEYGLPQTILTMKNDHPIQAIKARFWAQITVPEDLSRAEQILAEKGF
jgi:glucose-1-phosphate thymidylyltransferase